jgi:hypothetical protein
MYRSRPQHLIMKGWKPMKQMLVANWCGHGGEFMRGPGPDGLWVLVPAVGEVA